MGFQEMVRQENFTCELKLTLRAGLVVIFLQVSQQCPLPLEGHLTEVTGGVRLGFLVMFSVDMIAHTVGKCEL